MTLLNRKNRSYDVFVRVTATHDTTRRTTQHRDRRCPTLRVGHGTEDLGGTHSLTTYTTGTVRYDDDDDDADGRRQGWAKKDQTTNVAPPPRGGAPTVE